MSKHTKNKPLDRLKHHVTGAIERGEKTAITAVSGLDICSICKDLDAKDLILRAAAPELLEALKIAIKVVARLCESEQIDQIEKAIAKTEGSEK